MAISILLMAFMATPALFAASHTNSQGQAFDPELKKLLKHVADKSSSFEDKFEAQVWLTDMSNRLGKQVKDHQERIAILTAVHREAKRSGLQPELVLAVMDVESAFDRFAISRVGARGLMQIMPFWLDEIGRPNDNLFHIDTNVRFGCTILKYYIDMEKGNLFRALGRYNGSLGRAKYPNKVFKKLNNRWYVN
ncbi:MAG: lytic transglycosylase domain-containing protein [Gammaproteobacteria bacterium]|nr:lytic transglycosylase domain-containing protein [Gammaproteobacteria bacterium]NNM13980.1 lytic transglycosylase domain-containing protein [Gammaproteobacteria bacterium]